MNEIPDRPAFEPRSESVFNVWIRALTKPSEFTYAELASSPKARASTAFLWIFLAVLVQLILASFVQGRMYPMFAQQFGLDPNALGPRSGAVTILTGILCGAPIGAAIQTLVFAIGVAIVQWLAGMFGGRGTYDQLAYTFAAIAAPYSILVGVITLFMAIPYAGICFGLLGLLALLYVVVLYVMAIKGVNQVGWGAALGAFFIPFLIVACLCACLTILGAATLIPFIRQTS